MKKIKKVNDVHSRKISKVIKFTQSENIILLFLIYLDQLDCSCLFTRCFTTTSAPT